jgi:hypothetical protein
MSLENIRYHIAVTLLVLIGAAPPSGLIIFSIKKAMNIDEKHLNIIYLAIYATVVFFGLVFYTPRMRGKT